MSDSTPLPPVRLPSDAELARDALATPLLSRAARLARWAGPDTRVDSGGGLVEEQLPAAAEALGLTGQATAAGEDAATAAATEAAEEAQADAAEAWRVAVDTGLVEILDEEEGTVGAGGNLALLTSGSPADVLQVWLDALDAAIADASVPDLDDLLDVMDEGGEIDFSSLDWDPEAEAEFLEGALANLYLLTVDERAPEGAPVPLPALAASVIVPPDVAHPTDEMMEEVSTAMMRLDDQFRILEPVGLADFRPVDESLLTEEGQAAPQAADDTLEDLERYGVVRLTPLGLYGLRARLLDAGHDAPAVGDLADKGADALLDGTAHYGPAAARSEIELWLARRQPLSAARELLAAARGGDAGAPLRRLHCQQALSLAGAEAEPALREVLDDPELGGLARVWLAERGATGIPAPSQELVFWLTVDTVAAQLAAEGNSEELVALVEGLAAQHSGFFDTAWRVDHPATAEVLEAMGRLHPDKKVAKEARKAAYKARSQQGG
ncbi:hypothetical protein [Streptomyces sp. MJP52]|uniref:hypothetical protein n=1 Tax=Streptomyces sp. MJP52 TaxID=2940555 RepID=UPI0024748EB5|nr:hypothetical protein [Streptomyces sp. MJP52]MDH6227561.1 hypothetical protein [Streptomyces sp. MJP52]